MRPYQCYSSPLISIITVVLNGEHCLEETILSIIGQTYENLEYIIVDGGSSDGTVDVIRQYEHHIKHWISEPDNGLYDAMNKGMDFASKDGYFWFINAGDAIYSHDTLEKVFSLNPSMDVYYGRTALIDRSGSLKKITKVPNRLDWKAMHKGMILSHQSIIAKKEFVPNYNLQYRYVSDHDWVINILKKTNRIFNTDLVLSKYRLGGFSQENFFGCWRDRFAIINNHYSSYYVYKNYGLFFKATVKYLLKRVLHRHTG